MNSHDIAVIGMACVFPGARDLSAYWQNLVNGVDAITELPPDRWPGNRGTAVAKDHPAHIGCSRGGFIATPYAFDARRHRVMPNVARHGDADQFLLLDVVADALADAGATPCDAVRARTDLVVGRGGYVSNKMLEVFLRADGIERIVDYLRARVPALGEDDLSVLASELRGTLPPLDADGLASSIPNLVASRAANRLDLGGAAYTVDAACASSLIATEHAMARLRDGRADLAVAAGVNFTHVPAFWYLFTRILAISPTGRIRPFDRRADGMLIGEGAGAVVLKRADDAARDGDRVYALIRGVGSAGDGGGSGILAPSTAGQVRALERAYGDADIDPATIGFLEAHGTATRAGDETEIATIRQVFGAPTARHGTRLLGCVKSMIGHTMPAAGMASLIKSALALSNRIVPPSLHCDQPHEGLAGTDFFVNRIARPWLRDPSTPRRAGVNAFGFGGVNAHLVLEEVGASRAARACRPRPLETGVERPTELLVFAAPDRAALVARLRRLVAFVASDRGDRSLEDLSAALSREAATAIARRDVCSRLTIVVECDLEDDALSARLESYADALESGDLAAITDADGVFWEDRVGATPGKLAAVFPGIAFPGLIGDFPEHLLTNCLHFPCVREVFDLIEARDGHPGDPVPTSYLLVPPAHLSAAEQARYQGRFGLVGALPDSTSEEAVPSPDARNLAHVGMLTNNWASWLLLRHLGVRVDMLCGQSLGDVSAVLAAGMADFDANIQRFWDTFDVAVTHGGTGYSAVIGTTEECLAPYLAAHPSVRISLHLSPTTVVVGGPHEGVDALCAALRRESILAQKLPYPAIHTPALEALQAEVEAAAGEPIPLRPAKITIYSGVLAAPMPDDPAAVQDVLRSNVSSPVRFWQTMQRMYADGARFIVQIGSGTLAANSRSVIDEDDTVCVAMDVAHRHPVTQLQRLAGELFVHGFDVDLAALHAHRRARTLDLDAPRGAEQTPAGSVPLTFYWPPLHVAEAVPEARPVRSALPFLGQIDLHEAGVRVRTRVTLDLAEQAYLADHAFVASEGLRPLRDSLPVVPLTMTVELLAEVAACVAPGLGLVAVANVLARRWIAFEGVDALELVVSADVVRHEGGVVVVRAEARIGRDIVATADLEFAAAYRETLTFDVAEPTDAEAFPVAAAALYDERFLFHGPQFRALTAVDCWGSDGITGELTVLPRGALFASLEEPQLLLDPVVLDSAGQLVGASFYREDGYVLPIAIDRIELYRPPPAPGTRLPARVAITEFDRAARRTSARITVGDGEGGTWLRIDGWRDVLFRWPRPQLEAIRQPRLHAFATELLLTDADAVAMFIPTAALPDAPDAWLARSFLTAAELAEFGALGREDARRPWLLSRIAAKDAARVWIARRGGDERMLHPFEIAVAHDAAGRPVIESLAVSGERPQLSLAHTAEGACALVSGGPVGVDVEPVGAGDRLVLEHFATDAESARLGELTSAAPDGEWATRLWCAKEAAAKATGQGLGGRPRAWVARDWQADGTLRIASPDADAEIAVRTTVQAGLVIATAVVETS